MAMLTRFDGFICDTCGGFIAAPINKRMPDDEILAILKNQPNGEYAFRICRNCGTYQVSQDAKDKVEIVDKCAICLHWKDDE